MSYINFTYQRIPAPAQGPTSKLSIGFSREGGSVEHAEVIDEISDGPIIHVSGATKNPAEARALLDAVLGAHLASLTVDRSGRGVGPVVQWTTRDGVEGARLAGAAVPAEITTAITAADAMMDATRRSYDAVSG